MTQKRAATRSRTHVGFEQRFVASLRELELRPNQQIVVAFSGGKDSLAMAQLFARTKAISGVEPHLLHVDHQLRPTSGQEAIQARKLAKQVGLPIGVAELRLGLAERHPGLGIEEAARRERYLALGDFARRRRTDIIVVAHQQQDQAETVLLHLLRGTGLSGMQAMSALMEVQIPWWEGPSRHKPFRLWRPLLDEDPDELRRYLEMYELTPIEDSTNAEPDFLRNRIRHEVLPALDAIQPRATEVIARFAKIAALEDQFLESFTDSAINELLYDDVMVDRREAQRAHPVFLRRVLKRAIEAAGVQEIKFDRIEETAKLVFEEPNDKVIQLGDGVIAVSDEAWIYLGSEEKVIAQLQDAYDIWLFPPNWERKQSLEIKMDESVSVEGVTIHASEDPANFGQDCPWRRFVPREAFGDRLLLRGIDAGDSWARGGGTIRDQLRVNGIPPFARSRLMVFASDQGVWFVPGIASPVTAHPDLNEPVIYIDIRNDKSGDHS